MENQSQRPTCKCPDGYSLVDPSNDFGGCQLKSTLVCGADVEARPEDLYELLVARFGDYERIEPFSQEDCQQSCLQDCIRNVLLMESHEEKAILSDWAYDCYMEGRIDALLDDDDKEAMADHDRLQRWVKIAIWCIQEHHEIRPTMGMVMQMLQGFVQVPDPPSPSLN
ncbi:hypothetical protein SESBI_36808 [Sesbania bispinosa]|nr:hypothetical protein SESBI_36808 [Sesbania bispinosa]